MYTFVFRITNKYHMNSTTPCERAKYRIDWKSILQTSMAADSFPALLTFCFDESP